MNTRPPRAPRRLFRRLRMHRTSSATACGPIGALQAASSPIHLDRAPTSHPHPNEQPERQRADRPERAAPRAPRRLCRRLRAHRASSAAARGPEGALRAASSPTHIDRAPTSQPATPTKEGQHADRPGRHGGGGAFGGSARTEGAQRPLAKQKGHDQRRDQPTSTGPPPASQTPTRGRAATCADGALSGLSRTRGPLQGAERPRDLQAPTPDRARTTARRNRAEGLKGDRPTVKTTPRGEGTPQPGSCLMADRAAGQWGGAKHSLGDAFIRKEASTDTKPPCRRLGGNDIRGSVDGEVAANRHKQRTATS